MRIRLPSDLWTFVRHAAMWVTAALLALYFAVPVISQVSHEYETETAQYITVTESGSTEGIIIRTEEPLSSDMPYVSLLADNGEEVSAGSPVAVTVQSQKALEVAHRVREIETEIRYLRSLLSRLSTASDNAEQESAVRAALCRLSAAASREDAAELDSAGATLATLLSGGDATTAQQELDSLQAELDEIRASLSDRDYLPAPAAGVFSSELDGFESLAPSVLDAITPEGVESLFRQGAPVGDQTIGKIVTDHAWYYAAVMAEEDADRLRVGDETSLDFGYRSSRTVRAMVRSISATDRDGKVAVVFRCMSSLAETLSLRQATADVVFHVYSGLRVPRKAVHVENGQTVVFTSNAGQMDVKPVEILYPGEDFYLVAAGNEGNSLHAGNEIIVSGKNLGSGNVVN